MPIAPLPQDAVRLLRAHVVISTPVSVVKELLDNSIDAKATSIEVLVSRNTVDRIEVRDNGVGIETRDFEALGRRGHTSKLKSADELENIGGTSLGFRGEALAAVAAVAKVTVTTRTAADDTATVFDLLANGKGTLKNTIKSTPVGTTVTASEMFERLPVRKKVAIKEAKSTMVKMKQLLTAYALARPQLKLSIKEIGVAHPCLSYSPRLYATMKAAAACLFGSDLVAQCVEMTHKADASTRRRNLADGVVSEPPDQCGGYIKIDALVPVPGIVPVKISNKGAFFSVDSRPVSASRTVFKKIYSRFKKCISKSLEASDDGKQAKEPFIALNIKCPQGSYDVSIGPAKDDVLFTDEQGIIDACDALFENTYGLSALQGETQRSSNMSLVNSVNSGEHMQNLGILSKNGSEKAGGIDFSPSPNRPADASPQEPASDYTIFDHVTYVNNPPNNQTTSRDGQWSVRMMGGESSEDEDSLPTRKQPEKQGSDTIELCAQSDPTLPTPLHEEEEVARPLDGVNPWMLAKLNAAIKQANGSRPVPVAPQLTTATVTSHTSLRESQVPRPELAPGQALWDMTPATDAPISPPRFPAVRDLEFSIFGQSPVLSPISASLSTPRNVFRSPLLSGNREHRRSLSPFRASPQQEAHPESNYQTPPSSSGADQRPQAQRSSEKGNFRGGLRQFRQGKLFSGKGCGSNRPKGDSGGSVPRFHNPEPHGSDSLMPHLGSQEIRGRQPLRQLSPSQQNGRDEVPSYLLVRGRQSLRSEPSGRSFATATAPFSSIISLGAPMQPEITTRALLQQEASRIDDDIPNHEMSFRAAMRNKSRSKSRRRSKRLKSSMLALETATQDTLGLETWIENFDFKPLRALEEQLSAVDDYLLTGKIHEGLSISHDTMGALEAQLKSILYERLVDDSGQRCNCEIDLRRAMAREQA
ncbi:hypothetical protein MGG_04627 [Pyricularia oryzae 70-15]|uniref:DNA mismatch repair protein S5 domain-containing protein n=1 Tax=Pyricularia oryzae (strain 70-15 / ATCC MYA-4617 / FGSC 8958) TaxID=242507 RepID=G4MRP9_PYRO7|nr:uncharacterized protein MGG_04627 [Pyricularia oryzae 70-15]EHA58264.1 hypothetical protein MGG_04627 [Pyricularia oryzae 70-15]KAI7925694.1 hypothetical protein M9X92_003129 [Pyricularia oryzae]